MAELTAGVATIDITPPPGLMLAGFAARSSPSTGTHDPLTVRALVVGDTALVAVDAIGIAGTMSARIRAACTLPAANVVIAATHTHGAPTSMADRLSLSPDPQFLATLEAACVTAIDRAAATAVPATLSAGYGPDPDVARNRRHSDGPLDRALPVIRVADATGTILAVLVSYACHPTVLGADNLQMTADFPHYLRQRIEAAHPGATAIFVNGCTGDANIGHSPAASWTTAANDARSFANAERLGTRIGEAALAASAAPTTGPVAVSDTAVSLPLERTEADLRALAAEWQAEYDAAPEPARALLLPHWIRWAQDNADIAPGSLTGRVSLTRWGTIRIVALPGEIFAETALAIRAVAPDDGTLLVISYAEDTPGYIPPASEFAHGGYEVDEAYRFIGLPGRFAPGCAEALAFAAQQLLSLSR